MKSLLAAILVIGTLAMAGCTAELVTSRPSDIVYNRPVAPGEGYIWIDGDWIWGGGGYHWREGRWDRPRAGRSWHAGSWEIHGNGYRWRKGHW